MFDEYAEIYDLLYSDKDYIGECDFIESLISIYGGNSIKRILDVAAGTGSHALIMAERGYDVTAFDFSSKMAAICQRKAEKKSLPIKIRGNVPMTKLPPPESPKDLFDVALCLFSSINFLTKDGELEQFFTSIKKQLVPNGLLIFDYWNGIACLKDYSRTRVKDVADKGTRVIRISNTILDSMKNEMQIQFRCLVQKSSEWKEFNEVHNIRYFFPREMLEALKKANYDVLAALPFKELDRCVNENDWNVSIVARSL